MIAVIFAQSTSTDKNYSSRKEENNLMALNVVKVMEDDRAHLYIKNYIRLTLNENRLNAKLIYTFSRI